MFERDTATGLNTEKLSPRTEKGTHPPVYLMSRAAHATMFNPKSVVFKAFKPILKGIDGTHTCKFLLDRTEHSAKALLFGCQNCGDCGLFDVAFLCPLSQCPKNQRNGPCGGSLDGWCEVYPNERQCIWVRAYDRLKGHGKEMEIADNTVPPNEWTLQNTSSWLNFSVGARRRVPGRCAGPREPRRGEPAGQAAVGADRRGRIDLYTEMVEEAMAEPRGEEAVREQDTRINLRASAYLPEGYIGDVGLRLAAYKEIAAAGSDDELDGIGRDLEDRYGSLPEPARKLLAVMKVKLLAQAAGVSRIDGGPSSVSITFADLNPNLSPDRVLALLQRNQGRITLVPEYTLRISLPDATLATVMKKFALIWCSDNMLLEYRDYMLGQLSDGTGQWDVLSPADPNFAEQVKDYDGYVISGSEKSVVADLDAPLTQRLFAFIRDVRATSAAPVVGICFGAQALAAALDGRDGRNESGQFRLGVETLKWLSPSITQQWPEITDDITLVQSHGECVLKLPPDSVLLASSPSAAHELSSQFDMLLDYVRKAASGVSGRAKREESALKAHAPAAVALQNGWA